MDTWHAAQSGELSFWHDDCFGCASTYIEDRKQVEVYATRLNLIMNQFRRIDFEGKSYVDIGSGPTSILLKAEGKGSSSKAYAVDPLMMKFPSWVRDRYLYSGIFISSDTGENFSLPEKVDIALIYNVLQHVVDPEQVIENAKKNAKQIRIFEWIDHGRDEKHPHVLTKTDLDRWLGEEGLTEEFGNVALSVVGKAYYNTVVYEQ